jgi:protoporphyrinogen oxidase
VSQERTIVMGAGPAGLAAAHELVRKGCPVTVLEKNRQVGGLSQTCTYKDCYFDLGGHRFFTRIEEVKRLWFELLEDKFKLMPRLSRIFYRGKLFNYPIKPLNALFNLGPVESLRVMLSFLQVRVSPPPRIDTFEEWVSRQFGRRLYRIFFKTYTEKVWGIPCDQISAEWAAQRIRGLSLKTLLKSSFSPFKSSRIRTLIEEFHYPELGPGMMYDRLAERIVENGGQIQTGKEVFALHHDRDRITALAVREGGETKTIGGSQFLSSIPITELVAGLRPPAPPAVAAAIRALSFRAHVAVNLLVDQRDVFPDNWIYLHSPDLLAGRIQNYKNWSPAMVYSPDITTLGMEYFCNRGDAFWKRNDRELLQLARRELAATGLVDISRVFDGFIDRSAYAYPVYRTGYQSHLQTVRAYLERFSNLQCIGRSGQYQYNNMDHSILSGLLAARNIIFPERKRDIWHTQIEGKYIEY